MAVCKFVVGFSKTPESKKASSTPEDAPVIPPVTTAALQVYVVTSGIIVVASGRIPF